MNRVVVTTRIDLADTIDIHIGGNQTIIRATEHAIFPDVIIDLYTALDKLHVAADQVHNQLRADGYTNIRQRLIVQRRPEQAWINIETVGPND